MLGTLQWLDKITEHPQHLGVSFSKGPKYTGYEAFRQVIEQGINAQLFMAGEGVLKDAVEAYAMQHHLSDRVKMRLSSPGTIG